MNDTSLSLPAIIQCEGNMSSFPTAIESRLIFMLTKLDEILGIHGLGVPGATIFTSPIGLGASWNPEVSARDNVVVDY